MPNAAVKITDDVTKVGPVSVKWKTKAGHDAPVDGPTTFASSNEATAAIVEEEGGVFVMFGDIGKAQITATADADLGEGVEPVVAAIDIDYVPGKAVAGVIDLGSPA